jgi:hypothetical protein
MRHDIFQSRKCIHVKLTKEVHAALRARLFQHGISMQDVFDEFARQVAEGSPRAIAIVDGLVNRKLREVIDGKPKKRRIEGFGELDSEALYSLINRDEQDGTQDGKPDAKEELA